PCPPLWQRNPPYRNASRASRASSPLPNFVAYLTKFGKDLWRGGTGGSGFPHRGFPVGYFRIGGKAAIHPHCSLAADMRGGRLAAKKRPFSTSPASRPQ